MIRSGYGMIWFEQTGITTPFTLPQFPFVQTDRAAIAGQHQSRLHSCERPHVQVAPPNPNSGLGQGVFGVQRNVGLGLFAAVEFHRAEDDRQ